MNAYKDFLDEGAEAPPTFAPLTLVPGWILVFVPAPFDPAVSLCLVIISSLTDLYSSDECWAFAEHCDELGSEYPPGRRLRQREQPWGLTHRSATPQSSLPVIAHVQHNYRYAKRFWCSVCVNVRGRVMFVWAAQLAYRWVCWKKIRSRAKGKPLCSPSAHKSVWTCNESGDSNPLFCV